MRAAVHRGGERRRVGHVAGRELDAPAREPLRPLRVAHERPHVASLRAQLVDDRVPDEARAAGDEDLHASPGCAKFFQYRLGVGPRWPWYFEPSSPAPYGVEAGSLICMKEICPIFMPW